MWGRRAALAALLACTACGAPAPDAAGRAAGYDVLLVTLDTTRADHLGSYGGPPGVTPVLDGIAARGVRMADAVTVAPVTLPAHASILTGLAPPAHGVHNNGETALADAQTTLAEVLVARGYRTGAFVSAFVLDARFGLAQGFAHYDDQLAVAPGAFPSLEAERGAVATTDAALAWLTTQPADRPCFTWVHYYDPHAPYRPPGGAAQAGYAGEIAHVDAQVWRLLAGLEASGRRARTLVAVVGDHGESLGEHGETTHAIFVYDAVARVPFLIEAPGALAPRVVDDRVVSVVDVVPTVLALLGVDDGVPHDGVDVLGGPPDPDRAVWIESLVPYLDYGWAPLHALRRRHDKLILAPRPEYYDLRADPGELANRYDEATPSTAAARDALAADLQARLARQPAPATVAARTPAVAPEVAARLTALGYLAGAGPGDAGDLPDPKDLVWIVDRLVAANRHLGADRPRDALVEIADAIRAHPRDRNVLYLLGEVYLQLGMLEEAEAAYLGVQAVRPKADAALLLAQIATRQGRFAEAATRLDEAEGLDPRHGGIAIARGDLFAARGETDAADAAYARAAAIDPTRATHVAAARRARLPR